jgi:hypothetical protein
LDYTEGLVTEDAEQSLGHDFMDEHGFHFAAAEGGPSPDSVELG